MTSKGNIRALKTHLLSIHFYCAECRLGFSSEWKTIDHMTYHHQSVKLRCGYCGSICLDPMKLKYHENQHKLQEPQAMVTKMVKDKAPKIVSHQELKCPSKQTKIISQEPKTPSKPTKIVSIQELQIPPKATKNFVEKGCSISESDLFVEKLNYKEIINDQLWDKF